MYSVISKGSIVTRYNNMHAMQNVNCKPTWSLSRAVMQRAEGDDVVNTGSKSQPLLELHDHHTTNLIQ